MRIELVRKVMLGLCLVVSAVNALANDSLILFACGGNTGRSPMGEYLARDYFNFAAQGFAVSSRGVNVDPHETLPEANAVAVMQELHIDLSQHRAQQLNAQDVQNAQLVLTMTKSHKDKILTIIAPGSKNVRMLSECANGTQTDVADAYGQEIGFYRDTRDQIMAYIQQIKQRDGKCYVAS